ncbi:MAG: prenyltransferase/squalene oxidase repeat-containing protein [Aeoliella sp.]
MTGQLSRRTALKTLAGIGGVAAVDACLPKAQAARQKPAWEKSMKKGLDWVARTQSSLGHWTAGTYPTAMSALGGTALICSGSTTTQGPYAKQIRKCVDYITSKSRANGLIGDPFTDNRYTYGHGFSMLFLSQVLGEEEDGERRDELVDVLQRAVDFSCKAQTRSGGWGYVSAKDGNGFDEGSTTITQVQGLRSCRNAGIPVPKEVIDRAVDYIKECTLKDGGVQYSSKGGGGRPAITAAAIACLFNAGEYDDDLVPRMLKYCRQHLGNGRQDNYGHWHYAHFYYAQVQYREGGEAWDAYRDATYAKLAREANVHDLSGNKVAMWNQGYIGSVYTTSLNLIILQMDNAVLPIYQR